MHSFQTLLSDLATLTQNLVQLAQAGEKHQPFPMKTQPTAFQQHVFNLAGITP